MKTILHLGAHKTGTSLIQSYMRDNLMLMRLNSISAAKRSDVVKSIGWGNAEKLQEGLVSLERVLRRKRRQKRKAFVVSFENALGRPFDEKKPGLYPNCAASALALSERLSKYDPTIVYYIRRQDEFLESYYLQTVNEGSSIPFEKWLAGIDLESISWKPVVGALRDAFGAERVFIRDFQADMVGGQSAFLQKFFLHVRPDVGPGRFKQFMYEAIKNPSIGDKGLAIAMAANHLLENTRERGAMRVFLQNHFSNTQFPRPKLLSPEQKVFLNNRFAAENLSLITSLPKPEVLKENLFQKALVRIWKQ